MPLLVHAMPRPFRVHRQAVELPRQADSEIANIYHLLDFAQALGENFAILQCNQFAQRLLVFTQGIGPDRESFRHALAPASVARSQSQLAPILPPHRSWLLSLG